MIVNEFPILPPNPVLAPSSEAIPIPLRAARGVPQSVPVEAGGRRFIVTLLASVADVPALRAVPATDVLVDARAEHLDRRNAVAADASSWMEGPALTSLSSELVQASIAVREEGAVLGVRQIQVGRPLRFGTTASSMLAVEVHVSEFVVTAGMLIRPGETGGRIRAELALATRGFDRHETASTEEVDPYGYLA